MGCCVLYVGYGGGCESPQEECVGQCAKKLSVWQETTFNMSDRKYPVLPYLL